MASSTRFQRLISKAEGFLSLEMPEKALAALRQVDRPDQSRFPVLYLRGAAYRDLKQYEDALPCFLEALVDEPESVEVLLAMAWCYKRMDQLPRAISAMEEAYQVAPNESIVLYNMACYWSLAGDKANALSWLGRALRMDQKLRELIDGESDFDSLRHDPDFELIVGAGS